MPASRVARKRKKPSHAKRKPASVPTATSVGFPEEPEISSDVHRNDQQSHGKNSLDFSNPVFRQRLAPAILLVLVTFAIYIQIAWHPFTNYDDGEYVQQNVRIQHGITLSMLRWAFTSLDHANWHPVTWISHAVDWQLFGPSPAGHHVMSLLLHIVTVVLLFLVLVEMTRATVKSLLVALLFAVHPVSVESVAWIAERKNVLCTLFFLAALLAYASYARRPRVGSYLLLGLLFALSLASKAMTVTFPFVLLLLDFSPLRRIEGWTEASTNPVVPQYEFSKLVLEKVPFFALSLAVSIVTVIAQRDALQEGAKVGTFLRFENAIVSYVAYLWTAVWPTHLSVLYPFPPAGLPAWKVIASAVILVACSAMVWRQRSRGYSITGWCWFLGTLVPVIGLVQVGEQARADRYAYLPLIGIYIIAVWLLVDLAESARKHFRPFIAAAAMVVFVGLMIAAVRQVRVWRSNIDLWKHAVSVTEYNRGAEDILGDALLDDALGKGGRYSDEAVMHFQKALQIDPHDSRALFSLGMDLRGRGRLSEAIDEYKLALLYSEKDSPKQADQAMRSQILSGMASCYESRGDFMTARQYYQQAIQLSSGPDSDLFEGFAKTFTDEEVANLTRELTRHPSAQGYWQLGELQESNSRMEDAEKSYRRAVEIDPHFAPAQTAPARNGTVDR